MFLFFGISYWSLSLFLICAYVFRLYCKKRRILKFCKYQDGPRAYPFIGNIPEFHKTNVLQALISLRDKYTLPVNFWVFNDYYYITDNPDEIKIIFGNTNKSFSKAPFYDDFLKVLLGDTLVMFSSKQVDQWKFERKTVLKSFSVSMWKNYTPVFNKGAMKMTSRLKNTINFTELNKIVNHTVFEVFLENFMDISAGEEHMELLTVLTELQQRLIKRSALGRIVPRWFFKHFMKEGRRLVYLFNYFRTILEEFIQQKREEFASHDEYIENSSKLKLIYMLLNAEDTRFSNKDIYRQILMLTLTSIETTSLVLTYTVIQLGMNPNIQEKVYQEVHQQIGEKSQITTEDLTKLKYLEQAMFEAIRILPVIPVVGRHVTQDIDLGTKVLPKGCNVMILPYLVHRNEECWQDSEKYNPDRFSDKNVIQPGSYIPFLIGPRDCIGRYYSIAQVKVMIAHILKQYEIRVEPKTANDLKLEAYIVMKPGIDFDFTFRQRDQTEFKKGHQ